MNEAPKGFTLVESITVSTATPYDKIFENIKHNNSHGHFKIHNTSEWRENSVIAIVGGGPSLEDTLDTLRNYRYIMCCGSVHDYLLRNDIRPNWCVVCDPDPIVNEYLKEKSFGIKYLLASQCSPDTFEHVKNYLESFPIIWNVAGNEEENKEFSYDESLIGGGCTVGTRALCIAMAFGFTKQHLFGYDTCVKIEKTPRGDLIRHHAFEFTEKDTTDIGEIKEIKLGLDSPTFKVAGYMLGQLLCFKDLCRQYPTKLNVRVFGDGLLKYLVDYMHQQANEIINKEK